MQATRLFAVRQAEGLYDLMQYDSAFSPKAKSIPAHIGARVHILFDHTYR